LARSRIDEQGRYKRSKQRERILALLRKTDSHPPADWIYERTKDEFPTLSMGTVYRNLRILEEQGLVSKIEFGSTFDRFEARTDPHYHFVCETCGAIVDLAMPVDDELNERVRRQTGYRPQRHRIQFYGVCQDCAGGS
jgi:Fur family peroxide stress response transcriptional regulator